MTSTRNTARLAGLFWLMFVLATAFSMGYARSRLVAPGDPQETIDRLSSLTELYRASIAASLVSQVFLFLLGLTLFFLFRRASRVWATILLASALVAVAVAVATTMSSYAILVALSGADGTAVFSQAQLGAVAISLLRLGASAQALQEIFWTPFYIAFGVLVVRSRMMPALLGVPLILMGVGYFINVFTKLLAPAFYPDLMTQSAMLPAAVAALLVIPWLLVKGAREFEATGADDSAAATERPEGRAAP